MAYVEDVKRRLLRRATGRYQRIKESGEGGVSLLYLLVK
jgi:hypothetical protein